MIITCPKCAKAYRVDPAELPPAQMQQASHISQHRRQLGWYLSCKHCLHEWWFNAPKGISWYNGGRQVEQFGKTVAKTFTKYQDHTDLSGLYAYNPSAQEFNQQYHDRVMRQEYSPFNDVGAYQNIPIMNKFEERVKTSLGFKMGVSFFVVIVALFLGYIFGYVRIQPTATYVSHDLSDSIPPTQSFFFNLAVDELTFKIQCEGDQGYLSVKGLIKNTTKDIKSAPPMRFKAWAFCDQKSLVKNLTQGNPYCLVKTWVHTLPNQQIKPNESIAFETKIAVPTDQEILKVDSEFLPVS